MVFEKDRNLRKLKRLRSLEEDDFQRTIFTKENELVNALPFKNQVSKTINLELRN